MNSLLESLASRGANEVLWFARDNEPINVSSVISAFSHIQTREWYGKRVAIGKMSALELVAALVMLDGLAEVILLLPSEDDEHLQSSRLAEANVDLVIGQDGLGVSRFIQSNGIHIESIKRRMAVERPLRRLDTTWLLPTSGTTGSPKMIPHTLATLTRGMSNRRVGAKYVWGCLYSLRRFAGLQVFLQSWIAESPLVLAEDQADLTATLTRLISSRCNALSATPSMWRKLAMHPMFEKLTLEQVTLGGEIVDQAVLDMLTKRFPKARVTHIYASTEAGVGFVVRDGQAGFPLSFLNVPPSGVAMRLDDAGHLWLAAGLHDSSSAREHGSWIDSGDVVRIEGQRVYFMGRANGSINVGGNKVMPEEIESVIKELPDVAYVQVSARKSTMMGNLIEAGVKARPGMTFDLNFKKRILAHCRTRLDAYKIPAFVVELDEVVLSSTGKSSRISNR